MKDINVPLKSLLKDIKKFNNFNEEDLISSLCTDSRKIEPGDWFICLKGENHDSHEFIDQVLASGARGIIYEERRDIPGIEVENTNEFLGKIARTYRRKINPFVISVTGSNGKTSEKEMIYLLLNELYPGKICRTTGNFNNQFGVPYTILSMKENDKFLVVEMGTNHPGEIAYLSKITEADMAVITSISLGHAGNFGSYEEIVKEKSDIVIGMKENGKLLLSSELSKNKIIQEKADKCKVRIVTPGENCKIIETKEDGTRFLYDNEERFLSVAGRHQFENCRLALGVLEEVCNDKSVILKTALKLSEFKPVKGRLQKILMGKYNLWDDAYNANPASFKEAIEFLRGNNTGSSFFGAFGMMGELGDFSEIEHERLGELAVKSGMKGVFFSSSEEDLQKAFKKGWDSLLKESGNLMTSGNTDEDIKNGVRFLREKMKEGDQLLVKGSRSTKMERVFDYFN